MKPDTFEIAIDPWKAPVKSSVQEKPDFADDEALKQAFGVELAKGTSPFDAAMETFNQELSKALWASANWIKDPIVQASKDSYLKTLKKAEKPLDREELLSRILLFHDEKLDGIPLVEAKVRLEALKLYSEISGFTGRVNIDASTNINNSNTTVNNKMEIVLVSGAADKAPAKIIDHSNNESKIQNNATPPLALKLVGGSSR